MSYVNYCNCGLDNCPYTWMVGNASAPHPHPALPYPQWYNNYNLESPTEFAAAAPDAAPANRWWPVEQPLDYRAQLTWPTATATEAKSPPPPMLGGFPCGPAMHLDAAGRGRGGRGRGRPRAPRPSSSSEVSSTNSKLSKTAKSALSASKKKYTCDICHKRFSTAWYVRVHRKSHDGERPYVCHNCGKGFMLPNVLQVHLRKCEKNHNKQQKHEQLQEELRGQLQQQLAQHVGSGEPGESRVAELQRVVDRSVPSPPPRPSNVALYSETHAMESSMHSLMNPYGLEHNNFYSYLAPQHQDPEALRRLQLQREVQEQQQRAFLLPLDTRQEVKREGEMESAIDLHTHPRYDKNNACIPTPSTSNESNVSADNNAGYGAPDETNLLLLSS